jgi:hypothetical protein
MYLETRVINQNCIHEEIKSRLNSVNVCYHSDWSFYLPVPSCMGHKSRISEKRMLRGIFRPKREAG